VHIYIYMALNYINHNTGYILYKNNPRLVITCREVQPGRIVYLDVRGDDKYQKWSFRGTAKSGIVIASYDNPSILISSPSAKDKPAVLSTVDYKFRKMQKWKVKAKMNYFDSVILSSAANFDLGCD